MVGWHVCKSLAGGQPPALTRLSFDPCAPPEVTHLELSLQPALPCPSSQLPWAKPLTQPGPEAQKICPCSPPDTCSQLTPCSCLLPAVLQLGGGLPCPPNVMSWGSLGL